MVSGPGKTLGVRTTRQAPHSWTTLAATTQGPLPARKKPVRGTFANAVRRCQYPVIERQPRPVLLALLKTAVRSIQRDKGAFGVD